MFGDRFKSLRTSYRYTQSEVAERFNVSVQTVSNWENNNYIPGVETAIDIAKFFHTSLDYLFELDSRSFLEITGLTPEQLASVQKIIDYIRASENA